MVMTLQGYMLQTLDLAPSVRSLWGVFAGADVVVCADDQSHTLHVLTCSSQDGGKHASRDEQCEAVVGVAIGVGVAMGVPF